MRTVRNGDIGEIEEPVWIPDPEEIPLAEPAPAPAPAVEPVLVPA
jgi:hypothetical protein